MLFLVCLSNFPDSEKFRWICFPLDPRRVLAQYFQTGQDPSRIQWKQINTSNFQVIYPEEFDKQAKRITFVLEKVYNYGTKSLDFRPRKISVVLHTQTVKSNDIGLGAQAN